MVDGRECRVTTCVGCGRSILGLGPATDGRRLLRRSLLRRTKHIRRKTSHNRSATRGRKAHRHRCTDHTFGTMNDRRGAFLEGRDFASTFRGRTCRMNRRSRSRSNPGPATPSGHRQTASEPSFILVTCANRSRLGYDWSGWTIREPVAANWSRSVENGRRDAPLDSVQGIDRRAVIIG